MKGLILSGGKGTRLRPITHTSAKQLIPVANKPILFYGIEALKEAGIEEIGIVVGETHREIKQAVGDGKRFGIKVTYIHQPEPLGLAHAVLVSEEFLRDEPFLMYLGDNILKGGVKNVVASFEKEKPNALILLAKVPNPQDFGCAVLKEGRVEKLIEKPKEPPSDLALVGVYLFDANIFKAARAIKPSFRGELEITDAIQWLIDNGLVVKAEMTSGWWKDTGKPEDLIDANRLVLEDTERNIKGKVRGSEIVGRVRIDEGAFIENSIVRGPAVIGENSIVKNSYIGPFTSISRDVIIENTEIENSIVLTKARIQDVPGRVESSIIGKEVRIKKRDGKPKVHTFVLGDHSKVEIL